MISTRPPHRSEHYVLEGDRYVLYLGTIRALSTESVALLIDTRLPMLITHGDPVSVRRELDEMREVLLESRAPQYDKDWLLIECRPDVDWLNGLLQDPGSLACFDGAFTRKGVQRANDIAQRLLDRVARRLS